MLDKESANSFADYVRSSVANTKKKLTCQKCTEVGHCIVLVDANNRRYVQVSIGLKTSTSTFFKIPATRYPRLNSKVYCTMTEQLNKLQFQNIPLFHKKYRNCVFSN